MTENPYPVGTTVFAKLKGYPWWPARIEKEDDLPANVSGKKPKQRPIWPVFFFGSYDYGWFGASEIKAFDHPSAEKAKSTLKKGNALRTALAEALDPSLVPDRTTEQDDEEEEEEEDEQEVPRKKATKAKKPKAEPVGKKRRSSTAEAPAVKSKPSKRSVPADEEEDEESPKAKKRASVISRTRPESDIKSADEEITPSNSNNDRVRKSEEEAGDSNDLRAKKKQRSGQPNERLLKLRHKLQKLLLVEGLSDEVLVQNLERADPILSEVEAFEIDLQLLKDTKIGRLMKKISVLQFSKDPHRIVERSIKLIKEYKAMMEKAQENGEAVSPSEKTTETATPVETASSTKDQKPIGVDGVISEGVKPEAPIVSSHILDVPPVPEAVVAAVAAIVETNTLALSESSTTSVTETTTTETTVVSATSNQEPTV
ncbi:hypothetical protein BGZ76_001377 [Entomortierella beljakovae]|nr:hypothetical protein BGZ76_001377 [Entomortierella beljakovae]